MLLSSRAGLEVMFPRYVLAYNVHAIVTAVGTAIYIYICYYVFLKCLDGIPKITIRFDLIVECYYRIKR